MTSPIAAASAAPKVRPVRKVSAAARLVSRGSTVSEITAGASASRLSVKAKVTSSLHSTTSLAATIPSPPARTGPASRVTTGRGCVTIRRCSATSALVPSAIPSPAASERSAPEQNTRSAERITTTRASASCSARSSASNSSPTSCRDRALRFCGESRVIVAIPSARS